MTPWLCLGYKSSFVLSGIKTVLEAKHPKLLSLQVASHTAVQAMALFPTSSRAALAIVSQSSFHWEKELGKYQQVPENIKEARGEDEHGRDIVPPN